MMHWELRNDLEDFDLGKSGAIKGEYLDSEALCFQGGDCYPVWLRKKLHMESFMLKVEVACTPSSFVGLVFSAKDEANF